MDATLSTIRPTLRENVWHIYLDKPESFLVTTDGMFEVPTVDGIEFMRMRSYCTGHNTIEEIAVKSGLSVEKVANVITSLRELDLVRAKESDVSKTLPIEQVRDKLIKICKIWSDELKNSYIANELPGSSLPKSVLAGWLLEMHHYIRDFPYAIEHGAKHATGELRTLLDRYANEERGHEGFVTKTLMNIGLSRDEIEQSHPLPSTRLISFLMREMFELDPASVLLMAALVEAQEFDAENIEVFQKLLEKQYDLPAGAMTPYFEHQEIDTGLGHSQLLEQNINLFTLTDPEKLEEVVNKLHDLKHAFELQGTEIKAYYTKLDGRYYPRQMMRYSLL